MRFYFYKRLYSVFGDGFGIYWPDIHEDLSTEGLLRETPGRKVAAVT